MKRIKTNIYRRFYRNGKPAWMVRWWDEKACSWKALKAGDTEAEAIVVEAQLREDLLKGIEPTAQIKKQSSQTFGGLIDLFYLSPRYLSKTPHGQRVFRSHLEGAVRKELGRFSFEVSPKV